MDARGRIYITANREGRLWRFDPADGSATRLTHSVGGLASLAFGVAPFKETALFGVQLRGGHVWQFDINVYGAPLNR